MKVKKYQLILCLWVIITGGIVFIFFREKLEKNPIKGEIVLLIEPQEKEQRGGNKYVNDTD